MEDNLLTTEQLLLLENLTYVENGEDEKEAMRSLITIVNELKNTNSSLSGNDSEITITVEDVVKELDGLNNDVEYTTLTTGEDWNNILKAIQSDPTLRNMEIKVVNDDTSEEDNDDQWGGGRSVVFVNNETGEAVVAFRGTLPYEWKDNVQGGGPTDALDGVSTEDQELALAWYQSLHLEEEGYETITVIGHSKGGNKAMYIAIRDESVSRCVSFDGQGFSDEFVEHYKTLIAARQDKISNHCVEYDIVNPLLNSVGSQYYYIGYEIMNFLEVHCPNTFFYYDYVKDECYAHMTPVDGPPEEIKIINEFLNRYLRTLTPKQKAETLDLIGEIAEKAFNKELGEDILGAIVSMARESGSVDLALKLLDYTKDYAVLHPEFVEAVESMMHKCNVSDKTISQILFIINTFKVSFYYRWITNDVLYEDIFNTNNGQDLQVDSISLEKNRVFDTNKLTALGTTGKALMDTGGFACEVWDAAVADLKDLYDCLPGEVKYASLGNSLNELSLPFYSDEYDLMGKKIYNTTSNIVENIPAKDEIAAQLIDEIAIELSNAISVVKMMEENLVVSPM